jgi:hypothetical protein
MMTHQEYLEYQRHYYKANKEANIKNNKLRYYNKKQKQIIFDRKKQIIFI